MVVCAPALGRPEVLGKGTDLSGTIWYRWQVFTDLAAGQVPWETRLMGWPVGVELFLRNGLNHLDTLLSGPLAAVLGPFAGADAWSLLVIAANYLAFIRLSDAWCGPSRPERHAARLGAVLFALAPFALEELGNGRPTQALLVPLALLLRAALRLDVDPRAWVWGGVHLALCGLLYWYLALWGGLMALVVGLAASPRRTAALLASALAWVSPLLVAYGWLRSGGADVPRLDAWHMAMSLYVDGTIVNPTHGPGMMGRIGPARVLGPEAVVGLAALGWLTWRRERRWIAAAVATALCLVWASGPGSVEQPRLFYRIFLFSGGDLAARLGFPVRAVAVVALTVAAACSEVARRALVTGRLGPRGAAGLAALHLGALFLTRVLPLPTAMPPRSTVLSWLARQPPGAVFTLPDNVQPTWLDAQVLHQHPIQRVMGEDHSGTGSPELVVWAARQPAVRAARRGLAPSRADLATLRADGFAWVLLDRKPMTTELGDEAVPDDLPYRRALIAELGPPDAADGRFLLWRIPAASAAGAPPGSGEPEDGADVEPE